MFARLDVVIHHIQCHQSTIQLLVSHHDSQFQQLRSNLGVLHAEHDFLVVLRLRPLFSGLQPIGQRYLLCSMLRHHRRNDAGNENHDDNTIQHLVVHQIHPWGHFQLHTHHHHGNGTGSMSTSQSEHHITCRLR